MENNDWYTQYQEYQKNNQSGSAYAQPKAKKKKKQVSMTALVCCMLATALIAGTVGGLAANLFGARTAKTAAALPETSVSASVSEADKKTESSVKEQKSQSLPAIQQSTTPSGTYSRAQIVEIAAPSVVGIDVYTTVEVGYNQNPWIYYGFGGYFGNGQSQTREVKGSGSGVVISSDGYIVTCNHVVEGADRVTVILNDDTEYEAKVIGTDERNDLAIIKIDADGLVPATLGDSDMLTVGEDVVAIGNHLGELRGTATGGMISALNRKVNVESTEMTLLQHDAAISPGSSGGGLFNSSGSLIGIVNAKASSSSTNSEGLGFAIPVNDVKQIINDIIQYGYVTGRAYLGGYTQNVSLRSDRSGWGYFGGSETLCVQVGQVIEGYAADKAGIQANDLILKIGDTKITSNDVLSSTISRYNAGDTATVTIQRNGQEMELTVTFSEYAPADKQ